MAPASKLPSTSPMGEDIRRVVREMLNDELSLTAWANSDETITVQIMLGEKRIGKQLEMDVHYKTDHGHGGGHYVSGLKVKVIKE